MHTQCISLGSVGCSAGTSCGGAIGVNADEQVGLVAIGNLGSFVEFDEYVCLAGIHNFYIRAILLDQFTKGKGYGQIDVLFLGDETNRTSVFPPVTCVNDKSISPRWCDG